MRTENDGREGPVVEGPGELTEAALEDDAGETQTPVLEDETEVDGGTAIADAEGTQEQDTPVVAEPVVIERPPVQLDGVLSGPGGPYRLMISSHRFERDAIIESAETERKGVASEVVPAEIADRGTWYRVVVAGGYPRLAAAREVLDIVKSLGYEGAWIERAGGSN